MTELFIKYLIEISPLLIFIKKVKRKRVKGLKTKNIKELIENLNYYR
jgi:hypothetical protein